MGYKLAREARNRGANVILVSGPTNEERITGIETINIITNEEMYNAVMKYYDEADIVIKAAAVADYKPKKYSEQKIKKSDGELVISMVRDRDILFELGKNKKNQILVGFAAESQNLIENAVKKLDKKNLDFIVANDISRKDIGFAVDENKVTIISKENVQYSLEKMTKDLVAKNIFDIILKKR